MADADALTEPEARQRAALLEVTSYEVALDLTADPAAARSAAVIRFRCREPGAATFADLTAARVRTATLNGVPLDPAAVLRGGRLRLTGLAAENVLAVEADVAYSGSGQGLAKIARDGAEYVIGNCFPTFAPAVFCCFDQPDLRADTTLAVTAPAGWDCVAGGPVASRPAGGAAGTWRFAAVPGMKPYELALCAGPFVTGWQGSYRGRGGEVALSVRGRAALAGPAGPAGPGGLARAGDVVTAALAHYEQRLGVPCPYATYDIVFVPELGPLAVSLPGLMMAGESLLAAIADPGDRFAPMVLAHEVAHLWFGCLVEGRWWDDLWLAEALATYLSYGAVPGRWAEFGMREKAAAYQADLLPGAEPVAAPVASAAAALTRSPAITYSKGASIIRQLAALIGEAALDAGLHDYLVAFGGGATTLADLVGCWSAASGRDLSGWAERWLRAAGADTLTAELTLAADGTAESLAVLQDPPGRAHQVTVGLYDRAGGGLRRRGIIRAELSGARTELPGLAGTRAPDAVLVNDGDLTFARARFDARSWRELTACALEVSDPLTEAVAWNAAWDMLASAELTAGEFTGLVARRIGRPQPPPGLARLLERAVAAADGYAAPAHRAGLREKLAAAALAAAAQVAAQQAPAAGAGRPAAGPATAGGGAAGLTEPGRARALVLAIGFAAAAQSPEQLGVLRSWLAGTAGPASGGADLKLELRAQLLATLGARGRAGDDELDALAAADPASGAARRATCAALRPDPAAKQAAWAAALTQPPTLAMAHAGGFWAAGQEELLAPYRERYFAEALPALRDRDPRTAGRLARLLYPAVLPDADTIAATDAALAGDLGAAVRPVLAEQRAITQQRRAARALSLAPPPA